MRIFQLDVLAVLAAAHGVAAQSFIPNLEFDLTLDSMNAMFRWSVPERIASRNEATGFIPWVVDYPQSPTFTTGTIGAGEPVHFVTAQWFDPNNIPSFKFMFPGKGYKVAGKFTPWNATYDSSTSPMVVRTDRSMDFISDFSNGLGAQSDLAWSFHEVNYTINAPQYSGGANWTVDSVTMSTGMVSNAPSLDKVPKVVKNFVVNGQPNSEFVWFGNWAVQSSLGGVGGQEAARVDYMRGTPPVTSSGLDNITWVFIDVPVNTSFVMINGTMGPGFDGWFALWKPVSALGVSPQLVHPYSLWNVPDAVMLFQALNPQVHYNLSLALPETFPAMGISSITFYSAIYNGPDAIDTTQAVKPSTSTGSTGPGPTDKADQDTTTKKKTNVGAIAGGVVGGVLGLLLLGILIFCLARRRKKSAKHDADNSRFVVDDTPGNAVVSPFVTNQQNQQTQQTQPLLQSTMAQPQHTPVTQTYNVQGTGGGYTTSSYTNTHSGHGNGYSDNALASSSALETPASGVMPLLAAHRSASDMDESSSVSPSMSASMSGLNSEGKSPGTPGIASFSPHYGPGGHAPQTFPVSALEKSRSATAATTHQPITQELDAGAVSQYGTVPPVYDYRWSSTSPLENVAQHTGSAVGGSGDHTGLAHTATGPSGQRPSVQSVDSMADDASYRTPPEH